MQTHNMPMPSAVMWSARLLPTSAGLKTKNTTCTTLKEPNPLTAWQALVKIFFKKKYNII